MLPVGILMVEHRLIERVINLMSRELPRMNRENKANPDFLEFAVDFLRVYADKCHHGKEEDILFYELSQKPISNEHKQLMEELIQDHIFGRKTVSKLAQARLDYIQNQETALKEIIDTVTVLAQFYTRHIEKEDKHFFLPVMEYFDERQQEKMIRDFHKFDQSLIHGIYKDKVTHWEGR